MNHDLTLDQVLIVDEFAGAKDAPHPQSPRLVLKLRKSTKGGHFSRQIHGDGGLRDGPL